MGGLVLVFLNIHAPIHNANDNLPPHSMNCPPTKRLKRLNQDVVTAVAFDDPFGDDEEFTQDVLDEIDIIASQAITSGSAGAGTDIGSKPNESARGSSWSSSTGQRKPVSKTTTNHSRENASCFNSSNRENATIPSREPLGEFLF